MKCTPSPLLSGSSSKIQQFFFVEGMATMTQGATTQTNINFLLSRIHEPNLSEELSYVS